MVYHVGWLHRKSRHPASTRLGEVVVGRHHQNTPECENTSTIDTGCREHSSSGTSQHRYCSRPLKNRWNNNIWGDISRTHLGSKNPFRLYNINLKKLPQYMHIYPRKFRKITTQTPLRGCRIYTHIIPYRYRNGEVP